MRRRQALQILAVSPAAKAQELSVTSPEVIANAKLNFFSPVEIEIIRKLAATIVPSLGGRPGAIEAQAPEFLDFLLSRLPVTDQRLYHDGLKAYTAAPSLDLLNEPWTYAEPTDLKMRFLRRLKEDLLRATFNSREWASGRRGAGVGYYWKPLD